MKKVMFVFFFIFLFISLVGCSNDSSSSNPEKVGKTKKEVIKIGFFSSVRTTSELEKVADSFISKLSDETGLSYKKVMALSYDDLNQKLISGEADMGFGGPLSLVIVNEKSNFEPLVSVINHGKKTYRTEFLVSSKSTINTLDDLVKQKGLVWGFPDKSSGSGYLFPSALLIEKGIKEPDTFFTPVLTGGQAETISSLLSGNADFVTVAEGVKNSLKKEYPNILSEVKTIGYTNYFPSQTVMIRSSISSEAKKSLRQVFVKPDKETIDLFDKVFGFTEYGTINKDEYKVVEKAYHQLNKK